MTETVASMLIIAVELLLILAVGLLLYTWDVSRRSRRHRASARRFVQRVKHKQPQYVQELTQMLTQCYGFDDAAAREYAEGLFTREKALYSCVLGAYLQRSDQALEALDGHVAALLQGYRELAVKADVKDDTGDDAGDDSSPAALRDDNTRLLQQTQRLQTELHEANESMESMLREYVSMYGGDREQARRKFGKSAGVSADTGPEHNPPTDVGAP